MRKLSSILEEATLSFSKNIKFSSPPKGFEVSFFGKPPISQKVADEHANSENQRGKLEARSAFEEELSKLRNDYATRQEKILSSIQEQVMNALAELENRLPELIIGLFNRVLPGVKLDKDSVEKNVRSMIDEFSDENESLDVFLCPEDLNLLKALKSPDRDISPQDNEDAGGFASAISGIFDNLEGDDSLIPDYPNLKFHEDASLSSGDCQIKSRFGLLDGRIATKLRRIEDSMSSNG